MGLNMMKYDKYDYIVRIWLIEKNIGPMIKYQGYNYMLGLWINVRIMIWLNFKNLIKHQENDQTSEMWLSMRNVIVHQECD